MIVKGQITWSGCGHPHKVDWIKCPKCEIERLTARLIAESGEVEDLVNRLQESEDDNGRLMKRIAKLEADATCWTHGMNKEGTTGGMYLKANCPDCTAHIAKLESALRGYVKATTGQESATVTFPMALKGEGK